VRKRCICGKVDCQRHGSSGWAAYKRRHPERAAFYASSTWRVMRDRHLKANPTCVVCGQRASHVDHIGAIALGGSHAGQLQSMCAKHHHEKTVRDSHEAARRAAERRRENSRAAWKREER
jgi:5-methylcytosine-specific restriction endonuclease McrA